MAADAGAQRLQLGAGSRQFGERPCRVGLLVGANGQSAVRSRPDRGVGGARWQVTVQPAVFASGPVWFYFPSFSLARWQARAYLLGGAQALTHRGPTRTCPRTSTS